MSSVYQIESSFPIVGVLFPYLHTPKSIVVSARELAIAMASKGATHPAGNEIRVVHLPTGEVIFRQSGELCAGSSVQ